MNNQRRDFIRKTSKYAVAGGMSFLMTPSLSSANNYSKPSTQKKQKKQKKQNKLFCGGTSFRKCKKGHKYGFRKLFEYHRGIKK